MFEFLIYISTFFTVLFNLSIYDDPSIIANDSDRFFTRLSNSQVNLYARNVKSVSEYREKIKDVTYIPSFTDFITIAIAITNVLTLKLHSTEWLNVNKFLKLEWNIYITKNDNYENGLPHTRNDIIILNIKHLNSANLSEILLHEQLHIYQKKYTTSLEGYLLRYYKKTNNFSKLTRINPDTDNYIYVSLKDSVEFKCVFNNETPNSLSDVIYSVKGDPAYEHPLEYIVYDYTSRYYKN